MASKKLHFFLSWDSRTIVKASFLYDGRGVAYDVGSDDESVQKFGEQRVGRVGHELHAAFTYFLCFKSTPVPPASLPACVRGKRSGGDRGGGKEKGEKKWVS